MTERVFQSSHATTGKLSLSTRQQIDTFFELGKDKAFAVCTIQWVSNHQCPYADTVDSRYLEIEGTLRNSSKYPYFDISDL